MQPRLRNRLGLVAILVLLGFAVWHPALPWWDSPRPAQTPEKPREVVITAEEFLRIQPGMTYEQCVEIIGSEGMAYGASTDAQRPDPGVEWISMAWRNDPDSYAEISFNNGRVSRKRAYNLE